MVSERKEKVLPVETGSLYKPQDLSTPKELFCIGGFVCVCMWGGGGISVFQYK